MKRDSAYGIQRKKGIKITEHNVLLLPNLWPVLYVAVHPLSRPPHVFHKREKEKERIKSPLFACRHRISPQPQLFVLEEANHLLVLLLVLLLKKLAA